MKKFIIPMHFEDPEEESELYRGYVEETYRSVAEDQASPPSAESVFPALYRSSGLIDPMTFMDEPKEDYLKRQIETLRACTRRAFRDTPKRAGAMIEMDAKAALANPEPPAAAPADTTNPGAIPTASPAAMVPAVPGTPAAPAGPLSRFTPVFQRPVSNTVDFSVLTSEKKKIPPYRVFESLLQAENIRIIGEALYVYADGFYQHVSADCLRRLIMKDCREAVQSTGTSKLIEEVFNLLICEPDIFHQEASVDDHLLVFNNGVLDLRTGQMIPYSPDHSVFYRINTQWGNNRYHPRFDAFLNDITNGDPALKQRILEVIGYCISPDVNGKVFFVFQGAPDSGKSVLAKFIRSCLNSDACVALDVASLSDRFSLGNLVGKQLCLSMDITSSPLNTKIVADLKSITGGDLITADIKYRPHITFFNQAKFILGTNHPLMTQDEDRAFYNRVVAVPFMYSKPREQRDPNLLDALKREMSAIVYDAILAYRELRRRNYCFTGDFPINAMFYTHPTAAQSSTDDFIREFLSKYCTIDADGVVFIDDLFTKYCKHYPASSVKELSFGSKVLDVCKRLGYSGVYRGSKRRKDGHPNPQANLVGLTLKEDTTND